MGRRLALLTLGIAAALGIYFIVRGSPEEKPNPIDEKRLDPTALIPPISDTERVVRELTGALAVAPGQGFPASFPLDPLHQLAVRGGFTLESLIQTRPLLFLQMSLERHEQEVQGYTLTFVKKERIGGKLYPPKRDEYEIIDVAFREKPFSVFFSWKAKGKLAARVLYVEGENKNKMLARPFITALPIMEEDVNSAKAKNSGRYTIDEFGLYKATRRSVASMVNAEARGKLHLSYEGKVKLGEIGDRACYKFIRTPYEPLEEDALYELTLYFDCENWLQVGSVLRDPQGNLLAEYFFKDVVINPTYSPKQFTRDAL